jgi:phosphoribosylanthranilate isomerase
MTVRVKICGLTQLDDARLAVTCGADALGFVFWPRSPRITRPGSARAISRALPALVTRVGVFVDQSVDEVWTIVDDAGLDVVQLHGDESPGAYLDIGVRVIKAVALDAADSVERALRLPPDVSLLVDASDRDRRGGTGHLANWDRAARVAAERPILLAGGLTADNVAAAIRHVRPWGVDVSSGVESAPGIKDPERVKAFFAALGNVRREHV